MGNLGSALQQLRAERKQDEPSVSRRCAGPLEGPGNRAVDSGMALRRKRGEYREIV
jgi:hypothetical protein